MKLFKNLGMTVAVMLLTSQAAMGSAPCTVSVSQTPTGKSSTTMSSGSGSFVAYELIDFDNIIRDYLNARRMVKGNAPRVWGQASTVEDEVRSMPDIEPSQCDDYLAVEFVP